MASPRYTFGTIFLRNDMRLTARENPQKLSLFACPPHHRYAELPLKGKPCLCAKKASPVQGGAEPCLCAKKALPVQWGAEPCLGDGPFTQGDLLGYIKMPPLCKGARSLAYAQKSPPCAREGGSRQADGRVVRHRLSSISALNVGRLLRIMSWLTQVDSRRYPGQPNGSHGGTRMLYSFAFSENSSAVPNGALMSI